jgi:hypothetical protein
MSLFVRLKDSSGDDPNKLADLAKADAAVKELCEQLSWTGWFLQISERRYRRLFATPVDPKFIKVWRDFEDRLSKSPCRLCERGPLIRIGGSGNYTEPKPTCIGSSPMKKPRSRQVQSNGQSTSHMIRQLRNGGILMTKGSLGRALKTARQPGNFFAGTEAPLYPLKMAAQ